MKTSQKPGYLMVADTLGVNRSRAKGILTRYIREGRVSRATTRRAQQRESGRRYRTMRKRHRR